MNQTVKQMLAIGLIIGALLIPLLLIRNLIQERHLRQESSVKTIQSKWGEKVLLYGPILKIPYEEYKETKVFVNGKQEIRRKKEVKQIYFFPEELNVKSNINPEEKNKGIYKTTVYSSDINLDGFFDQEILNRKDKKFLWGESELIMQTTNVKGITEKVSTKFKDQELFFSVHEYSKEYASKQNPSNVFTLKTKLTDEKTLRTFLKNDFKINYNVKASEEFQMIPIADKTQVNIKSSWNTPNFIGEYLPYNPDKIKEIGFDAKWKVLEINRPFSSESENNFPFLSGVKKFSLGVNFMHSVDRYTQVERSVKYGFLVIFFTFLFFFIIQHSNNINLHPFEYLLIGLGLLMFYTLLLSISEHQSFMLSYIISASSVILLLSWYSFTILKKKKFTFALATSLSSLYLFIYVINQMEEYALLIGSLGIFIILFIVMYFSRKINWNETIYTPT